MRTIEVKLPENIQSGARFKGVFDIEVKDKQGNLISKSRAENKITDEGLNALLNIMFHGATQITTWYCVIFESDTTPTGAETYAVPVYTEWQAYDEEFRPEYEEAESVAESTTNAADKAVFTANASKTLHGAALVGGGTDPSVKGDTAGGGTLNSAGKFITGEVPTPQPVVAGNVVNLSYTVTAADAA